MSVKTVRHSYFANLIANYGHNCSAICPDPNEPSGRFSDRCEEFLMHGFSNKIIEIRQWFDISKKTTDASVASPPSHTLSQFSQSDLSNLERCHADCTPTQFLKQQVFQTVGLNISIIINRSLCTGTYHYAFKHTAVFTPLKKKSHLLIPSSWIILGQFLRCHFFYPRL